jgi:hypothetical protein
MLGEEVSMPRPTAADRAAQAKIAAQLGSVGFALPGTIIERRIRCGKKGCRCGADPPQMHGPYYQWTRKVKGVTETRLLSAAQMAHYGIWFENAKQLRRLTTAIEALSLDIADSAEDWS